MTANRNKQNLVSFAVGVIFSAGLAISGMTQPHKVIGFLNPWNWDPSLLFVMVGAIATHAVAYPLVRRRRSPILAGEWHIPHRKDVPARLLLGSALFGAGWGLAGYCPGPAVTSLASGHLPPFVFVLAMLAGMLFFKKSEPFLGLKE